MTRPRRFYVTPCALNNEPIRFGVREAHHVAVVLRMRPGDRVIVFDGRRECDAVLLDVAATAVLAQRTGELRPAQRSVELALLQGVARGPKMDLIVRMATELGVSALFPVLTTRSVSDPGPARVDRWRRVAQEAARQSGRGDIPEIANPGPLAATLALLGPVDVFLIPWEEAERAIGDVIAGTTFARAAVLIGPEGGLAASEVDLAREAGGHAVSLGPLILRTETAGAVTAAMLLYERLLRTPVQRRG